MLTLVLGVREGLEFESRSSQILHSITNGSPAPHHFHVAVLPWRYVTLLQAWHHLKLERNVPTGLLEKCSENRMRGGRLVPVSGNREM